MYFLAKDVFDKCALTEENRLESLMDFLGPFDALRKLDMILFCINYNVWLIIIFL